MEINTELDLDLHEAAEDLLNEIDNLQDISTEMTAAIFFMKSCHTQLTSGTYWDDSPLTDNIRKEIEYSADEWEEDAVSCARSAHKSAMKVMELSRELTKLANF